MARELGEIIEPLSSGTKIGLQFRRGYFFRLP